MDYNSVRELIDMAGSGKISDVVLACQADEDRTDKQPLIDYMRECLHVMETSVESGMQPNLRSNSGMVGGQAYQLMQAVKRGDTLSGEFMGSMEARALAVAECNACMGKIVASPTAGSCGIIPGALLTAREKFGYTEDELVAALFTAAGFGKVIAQRASISGAEGGCQAECGSAAAMAAAALVELRGGSAEACGHAAAFALMNMMGLVCDPLEGLVEIPCVYRNVAGVANAVTAADMALAGIKLILPVDEVIDAMGSVGRQLPESLRETGRGGCALCRTASSGNTPV